MALTSRQYRGWAILKLIGTNLARWVASRMDVAANGGRCVHVIRAAGFPMSLWCGAPLYMSGVVAISGSIVVCADQDNRRASLSVRLYLKEPWQK
jgi:hypothetical protein